MQTYPYTLTQTRVCVCDTDSNTREHFLDHTIDNVLSILKVSESIKAIDAHCGVHDPVRCSGDAIVITRRQRQWRRRR